MQTFPVKIYNTLNPAGIDSEIGKLQAQLARITWLDTIYGRVNIQRRQLNDEEVKNRITQTAGIKGRDLYFVYYPQGKKLGQDIDLSFSDDYPSCLYFYLRDPVTTPGWDFTEQQIQVAQPLSVVFWCDMTKLNPGSTDNYSEQLKITLLSIFNDCPRIVVQSVSENGENVLRDFSVTQKNTTFTRYPYCVYRFDMILTYPALPENGNAAFDPAQYYDPARQYTSPNTNPGNANLS